MTISELAASLETTPDIYGVLDIFDYWRVCNSNDRHGFDYFKQLNAHDRRAVMEYAAQYYKDLFIHFAFLAVESL